jgi:uncharacterized protein with PIN domain
VSSTGNAGRPTTTLVVDPELRMFLFGDRRCAQLQVAVDGTSTLGHIVQSAGIPLTEVGTMDIGGRHVKAQLRPTGGEMVRVGPVNRPQPLPVGPRFVLDVHLGSLVRRLRLLGVDATYFQQGDDDQLIATALLERRMLLTQDRALLRRAVVRDAAAFVRGHGADEQQRDVLDRFHLRLSPYSRCLACNGPLRPVTKGEVAHRLNPGTLKSYDDFQQCESCRAVYWRGAHAVQLARVVERAARSARLCR